MIQEARMINSKLIFRTGALTGNEVEIKYNGITIGRDPACDLTFDDVEVSRTHARIYLNKEKIILEDKNSTNGTFVNGKQIIKITELMDGDLISFGENNVIEVTVGSDQQFEKVETSVVDLEKPIAPNQENLSAEILPKDVSPEKKNRHRKTSKNLLNAKLFTSLPTWAVILFITAGFFILFCLVPFVIIEVSNQWCNLFSGFFNAISDGICP